MTPATDGERSRPPLEHVLDPRVRRMGRGEQLDALHGRVLAKRRKASTASTPSDRRFCGWALRRGLSLCRSVRRCRLRDAVPVLLVRLREGVGVVEGIQRHVTGDRKPRFAAVEFVDDLDGHLVGAGIPEA